MVIFESLLAKIIEKNGISTIKTIQREGIEEDITMGGLIKLCREHDVIDKDDLFLIDVLLCNKNGLNLRNITSHRLVSDSDRSSNVYMFCGYLLIRLLIKYGNKIIE